MHKRLVNYCTIAIDIIPEGPILIKSGKEGADPTKPDMEFVETFHSGGRSVYLPGSGLKGAIRAHAEGIVRTIGKSQNTPPSNSQELWANDPLNDKYKYLENQLPADIYRLSSFTDQMFGNTAIASRVRIEDAYPSPDHPIKLEERNGVAIDRVFGSVAVGPFNYEVCTSGCFQTKIHLKNFTLSQISLLGLVLRDLNEGWFGLGFAKSRGLGLVSVEYKTAKVCYPGCVLNDDQITLLGSDKIWGHNELLGAGEFLTDNPYQFPANDAVTVPVTAQEMNLGFGVELNWTGHTQVEDLFIKAMASWRQTVGGQAA
jgi:CRISPR/Cas system CSM-associated protein Csm3 (group 7 of RAMP superfamily)